MKFYSAPLLFDGNQFWKEKCLVLDDQGVVVGLVPSTEVNERIDFAEGCLCPGFVNTHCHLELSHLKGKLARGEGMVHFLLQVAQHRNDNPTEISQAAAMASSAMFDAGISAVGDICNGTDALEAKLNSKLYFHHFVEALGFVPEIAAYRMLKAQETATEFKKHFGEDQVSLVPHATYTVAPELFSLINSTMPGITTLHNQESQAEEDFIQDGSGDLPHLFDRLGFDISFYHPPRMSSMQYALQQIRVHKHMIWVHNCFTSPGDLARLQKFSALQNGEHHFCICANANIYIGNPVPNPNVFWEAGFSVCIGTDSLASNEQLSILAEIKVIQELHPSIAAEKLLQAATAQGARALGIENKFGRFAKGLQPGVLLLKNFDGLQLRETIAERII